MLIGRINKQELKIKIMKKYRQAAISIAFLTMIMTAGLCAGYLNKMSNTDESIAARQEAIMQTFEDNDYDKWKRMVKKKRSHR